MLTIKLEKKDAYGRFLFYPLNSAAQFLCELTNQKALTEQNVQLLEKYKDLYGVIIEEKKGGRIR